MPPKNSRRLAPRFDWWPTEAVHTHAWPQVTWNFNLQQRPRCELFYCRSSVRHLGITTSVTASNLLNARELAKSKRWGPPVSRQKQEAAVAVARAGVEKRAALVGAVMRHAAAKEATEAARAAINAASQQGASAASETQSSCRQNQEAAAAAARADAEKEAALVGAAVMHAAAEEAAEAARRKERRESERLYRHSHYPCHMLHDACSSMLLHRNQLQVARAYLNLNSVKRLKGCPGKGMAHSACAGVRLAGSTWRQWCTARPLTRASATR